MSDKIYHPEHYNVPGKKECWDEFIDQFGPKNTFVWCLMTAQKYIYRAGLKVNEPEADDLAKAVNYFKKAVEIRNNYQECVSYNTGLFRKTMQALKKLGAMTIGPMGVMYD